MKRLVFITTFLALICHSFFPGYTATETPTVGFVTGAGGLGDDTFTDMAYIGLRKAQAEYGFRLIIEEPGASGTVSEATLKKLIRESDILVLLGTQHSHLARKYAPLHPRKRFLSFDDRLGNIPNLLSIIFRNHEGSFMVGALAGWMSKSKKVGFIGGSDYDVIHAFRMGYLEGVRYADPKVRVFQKFIIRGPDAAGFINPKKAYEIAGEMYKQGVDIIYNVAGPSGNGIIYAAKEYDKFAIGVDTDQDHMAKGNVLTSMIKHHDMVLFQEISRIMEGDFQPGVKYYGLKEGGVKLSSMKYTKHLVPKAILKKLEDTKNQILSGKIKVTNILESRSVNEQSVSQKAAQGK